MLEGRAQEMKSYLRHGMITWCPFWYLGPSHANVLSHRVRNALVEIFHMCTYSIARGLIPTVIVLRSRLESDYLRWLRHPALRNKYTLGFATRSNTQTHVRLDNDNVFRFSL